MATSSATNTSSDDEITSELQPLLRVYKDGRVERLLSSPVVPPSLNDPQTGVSSKDITISPTISARLYLPNLTTTNTTTKIPLLLYFHGGGFCIGSAFSFLDHRYISLLSSRASALVVSVEYRLAPEHPLPAAYDDAWHALQWLLLLSHSPQPLETLTTTSDPHHHHDQWLLDHADFDRLFLGGDSAGANIAHNVAMRAAANGLASKIRGVFLSHPYFWGSARLPSEEGNPDTDLASRIWLFVSPSSTAGLDDPLINPFVPGAPSLAGLGCSRVLVCVAGGDTLNERGKVYCDELKKSGFGGEVELFEIESEGHAFHVFDTETDNAKLMLQRLASFLNQ